MIFPELYWMGVPLIMPDVSVHLVYFLGVHPSGVFVTQNAFNTYREGKSHRL